MSKYLARIGEWQPISWDLLAGHGARYTWAFSLLLALAIAAVACATAEGRRLPALDAALVLVFGALAFRGVRLVPEFAIACVPGTFAGLAAVSARLDPRRGRALSWVAAGCIALALPAAALDRSYEMGLGVKERIFPGRALAFAERTGIAGRVFNSFAFGDWLVFHAPHRPVYIHGRNEVFPEAFYEEFRAAHRDPAVFEAIVARYGIEWLLLEYELTDYARAEEMPHLLRDPRWVPVYWDRVSVVYVRKDGPNGALAASAGFSLVRPSRLDFSYLDALVAKGQGSAAIAEFERLLALAPTNDEAALGQAYVLHGMRAFGAARAALERALAVNPARAMTHSALGLLALRRRDLAGARGYFDRALALDPGDPAAIDGLGRLGVKVARATPAGHP
jgi:tetratricopeptide (TPR) repeat protein